MRNQSVKSSIEQAPAELVKPTLAETFETSRRKFLTRGAAAALVPGAILAAASTSKAAGGGPLAPVVLHGVNHEQVPGDPG